MASRAIPRVSISVLAVAALAFGTVATTGAQSPSAPVSPLPTSADGSLERVQQNGRTRSPPGPRRCQPQCALRPGSGSGRAVLTGSGFAVIPEHRQDERMNWFTGRSTGKRHATAEKQQSTATASDEPAVRMTAWVHGMVQGVGFRWWTRSRALELGLVGSAKNLLDGRVEVVVEGPQEACDDLLGQLRAADTPGRVDHVEASFAAARGELRGFIER